MNASGRVPNASSARRAVPNRLVTSGKSAPFTLVNSKRRPAGGDHAAMDLGGLEIRIDRRADLDELPIAPQLIDERSQIPKTSTHRSRLVHDPPAEHRHHAANRFHLLDRHREHIGGQHREIGEHADRELALSLFP